MASALPDDGTPEKIIVSQPWVNPRSSDIVAAFRATQLLMALLRKVDRSLIMSIEPI